MLSILTTHIKIQSTMSHQYTSEASETYLSAGTLKASEHISGLPSNINKCRLRYILNTPFNNIEYVITYVYHY